MTLKFLLIWFISCLASTAQYINYKCAPRQYAFDSVVCVCNSTYCDTLPPCTRLSDGYVNVFETSRAGSRFESTVLHLEALERAPPADDDIFMIKINSRERFQEIVGFGGAFTDSTGINIASLSEKLQHDIISSYFSREGSEYNLGRVPIAGSDFSVRPYSYDDYEGDFGLKYFSLAEEDYDYKIPYIRKAMSVATDNLYLLGTPWSVPFWMKTSQNISGGTIIPINKYFVSFSQYVVKFIQHYEKHGVRIWGLTVMNEPLNGFMPNITLPSTGLTAEMEKDFVRNFLGPILTDSGYGLPRVQLLIGDDQRSVLPDYADVVLADDACNNFVSGIAFHWYTNSLAPPTILDTTLQRHPHQFLLATEACRGSFENNPVELGSWERGESYAQDIIQDLLHSTSGWIDWNLVLDEQGGPNFINNFVDSPIIVNATAQEFYKQPMYYTLAHFSKLTPRNSVRIQTFVTDDDRKIDVVGFLRPDGGIVIHALNREETAVTIRITTENSNFVQLDIPGKALQSYVYWPEPQKHHHHSQGYSY